MLLGSYQTLRDTIIQTLLQEGALSYAELRTKLLAMGAQYTKQAIYTELNQLIRQLVVIKRKRLFELRLCWLSELNSLVTSRLASYRSRLGSMPTHQREEIECRSLHEAQSVWSALVHELMFSGAAGCYYEWIEDCWFQLSSSRTEEQILSQHAHFGVEYRLVLGRDTPLSRDSLTQMGMIAGGFCVASKVIPSLRGICVSVLGDCSITIKMPESLTESIERFFGKHQRLSEKAKAEFSSIAEARHDISIVLRRDQARAHSLRTILEHECSTNGVVAFGAAISKNNPRSRKDV